MPNYRCCVGNSNNGRTFPDKTAKRTHVAKLKFHFFLKNGAKRQPWKIQLIKRALEGFVATQNKVFCSIHFEFRKRKCFPNFSTLYDHLKGRRPISEGTKVNEL